MVIDERDEVFAELVGDVLDESELTAAMARTQAPSSADLRARAWARRDMLLGHARAAEEEYREAVDGVRRMEGTRRLALWVAWIGGAFSLLIALAASVVEAWDSDLNKALTERRPLSAVTVLSGAAGLFFAMVFMAALVATVTFHLYRLSRGVRAKEAPALARRYSGTVLAAVVTAALLVNVGASRSGVLTWQLVQGRAAGEHDRYDWGFPAGLAVALLFVLPYLLLVRVSGGAGVRVWRAGFLDADRAAVDRSRAAWRDALSEALRGFLRAEIGAYVDRRYAMTLELDDAPGLRQVRGLGFHVSTAAEETLLVVAGGMDGGSIALSGPRGVGKTDLLHAFCLDGTDRLGLVMAAPVVYERREFMLGLFAELCRLAISSELAAGTQAAGHLQWIQYLQTRTDESGVAAGWGPFGVSAKRGASHTRQPLTYLEIVDTLKAFLTEIASELTTGKLHPRGLVVGIDELDRIDPAHRARDFINELKVVFDVPCCLFLLSISDEALREADLAPVGHRDVFDSAIDEIIRVHPLDLATATRLLDTRAVGIPAPFTALFHSLSGGMPRDLLRTARAAAALVTAGRPGPLQEITRALLAREAARLVNDHDAPSSVRHVFLRTLEEIFTHTLTKDHVLKASDPSFEGSFDTLARTRRDIGVADDRAARALGEIRRAWGLPEGASGQW
ncbi:hypothetical protein [Sphaerisporangium aureirubrum]|uniref:KAP NTPase domain-containing protein n=1 Tax=Sphaerisporangium aureirubrum TaxID=1544736 RepID=A0ABW1NQF2_9ACTN